MDGLSREDIVAIVEETIEKKGLNKKKRKPSEYNNFIGACRLDGKGFSECVEEWKKKKPK